MKTSDFYFDLPEELIAQEPLADRASSRLMVVHKDNGRREHRHFRDIKEYLRAGDCLVINNTKVLPARLYGERVGTGAAMEILLLVRKDMDTWEVLVRPGKKARPGDRISFGGGKLIAEVLEVIEAAIVLSNLNIRVCLKIFWRSWAKCPCPLILHISWRIKTAIRRFMRSMRALRRHPRQVCILRRNY